MYQVKAMRKFTKEEKLKVIEDVQRLGVIAGIQKHGVSKSHYYNWLHKYNASGIEGLEDQRGKNNDAELRRLQKENQMLKELLAEKELEGRMRDELLKKKQAQWRKERK